MAAETKVEISTVRMKAPLCPSWCTTSLPAPKLFIPPRIAEFADAISNLYNGGASIVVDDVLFLTESSYQDDLPAIAASNCVAKGIPYVSAVGNDGDQGHRFVYRDSNRLVDEEAGNRNAPTGSDLHNWSQSGTGRFMAVTLPAERPRLYCLTGMLMPA